MAAGDRHQKTKFWGDLDRRIKVLVGLLVLIGIGLFALGLWSDATKAWAERPFWVNMASGATSACFGIPIAVVVIRTLLSRQQERTETLKAHRLAAATSRELRVRVWEFVQDEEAFKRSVSALERDCQALGQLLFILSPQNDHKVLDRAQLQNKLEKLQANVVASESAVSHGLIKADQAASITEEARASWEYMHTFVRPQLIGADSDWISGDLLASSKAVRWQPFAEVRLEISLAAELRRIAGEFQQGYLDIGALIIELKVIYQGLSEKLACVEAVNNMLVFSEELDQFMIAKTPK